MRCHVNVGVNGSYDRMAKTASPKRRSRGYVRKRGNSYQVLVYAGVDPITGKDSYLTESTRDEREAEKIKTRLLAKVDQQRTAATKATLAYTLDAWFDTHDGEEDTLIEYRGYAKRTIKPALGDVPIAKLDGLTLERFYARLRRCGSLRCNGKLYVEHATDEPHECGTVVAHRRVRAHDCEKARCQRLNCKPHECRPFAPATVLQILGIISGATYVAVGQGASCRRIGPLASHLPAVPLTGSSGERFVQHGGL